MESPAVFADLESKPNCIGVDLFIRSLANIRQNTPTISPAVWITTKRVICARPEPADYWNLVAAMYAHIYAEEAKLGIDAVGESAAGWLPISVSQRQHDEL